MLSYENVPPLKIPKMAFKLQLLSFICLIGLLRVRKIHRTWKRGKGTKKQCNNLKLTPQLPGGYLLIIGLYASTARKREASPWSLAWWRVKTSITTWKEKPWKAIFIMKRCCVFFFKSSIQQQRKVKKLIFCVSLSSR